MSDILGLSMTERRRANISIIIEQHKRNIRKEIKDKERFLKVLTKGIEREKQYLSAVPQLRQGKQWVPAATVKLVADQYYIVRSTEQMDDICIWKWTEDHWFTPCSSGVGFLSCCDSDDSGDLSTIEVLV